MMPLENRDHKQLYDVLPGPHFFWVMRTREEGWNREGERGKGWRSSKSKQGAWTFGGGTIQDVGTTYAKALWAQ